MWITVKVVERDVWLLLESDVWLLLDTEILYLAVL